MKEDKNLEIFPEQFFWGASTASHQVEGKNQNQWSEWELANAHELAQLAHQRLGWLPNWREIRQEAENPDNYISGRGVDHLRRYKEDFDLIKEMHLNSFRFGIEWSRLEPEEGQWDKTAFNHYRAYIKELRKRGIEPFLNIWHWTHPVWFAEKGGFENGANLVYFDRLVQKIAEELLDDVTYVITINEPNVYATFSYLTGEWPPEKKNVWTFLRVYYNLARAHRRAYRILKAAKPNLQIGLASQLANIQAKHPHNLLDQVSTKWMRYFWNWWFLNRVKRHQDFVGFNYYFTDYYYGMIRRGNPTVPTNDLGWYMEPEGLYPLLLRVWSHYKKPIIVTENGVADSADQYRQWWLQETIVAMERALSQGVQIRGYLHWSLLDNFEWKYGWWPKFGLIEVDRGNNMRRKIRPSAKWFAERIKNIS